MFLRNKTDDTFSLIDGAGVMTVSTPGLSVIQGSSHEIAGAIESSQLDLEVLEELDVTSMTVASFDRLVKGQMTLEALGKLRGITTLKAGAKQALAQVAA